MKPPLTTTDCIPLDTADELRLQRTAATLERADADPRGDRFQQIGMRTETGSIIMQPENGKLILNDGDEATTDVWQRLALTARKPVRALDVEPVVSCLH